MRVSCAAVAPKLRSSRWAAAEPPTDTVVLRIGNRPPTDTVVLRIGKYFAYGAT